MRRGYVLSVFAVTVAAGWIDATYASVMNAITRPRTSPVIAPAVVRKLETSESARVWIYFTDKGVTTPEAVEQALAEKASAILTPGALARRQLRGTAPLGVRDLPVVEAYVDRIVATGARLRHRTRWLNAVSAEATRSQILAIAELPFAASIQLVRGVPADRLPPSPPAPGDTDKSWGGAAGESEFYGGAQTQMERVQIVAAHDRGYSGAGVTIAMFDTGFDRNHPALRELDLRLEHDFVQDDDNTADEPNGNPPDLAGGTSNAQVCHGTSTWSAAGGFLPGEMVGAAFGASFLIAKTEYVPTEHHGEEDNWLAAAEWADENGADIISSSLAYRYQFDPPDEDYAWEELTGDSTIVAKAANVAAENGIVVVNSAGNDGPDPRTISSPSDSDSVLAVGAVLPESEVVTSFSSRGPVAPACPTCNQRIKPDVMTQGFEVFGATADGCYDDGSDPEYSRFLAGTSFSCPIAAGAAALVLEAHPTWPPYKVREALKRTAVFGNNPDVTRGHGAIRTVAAIDYVQFGPRLDPVRPRPFTVISPLDFTNSGDAIPDSRPTFEWHASAPGRTGSSVTYAVDLSPDPNFLTGLLHAEGVVDTTLTFPVDVPEGYYYWRAAADDGSGYTRQSSRRPRILIDQAPQPFSLLSPPDGSIESGTLFPTFTWEASLDGSPSDTVRYAFYLSEWPDTEDGYVVRGLTETALTLPDSMPIWEGGSQPNANYWKVVATDRWGARMESPIFDLRAAAFPPSACDLTEPTGGDSTRTRRPTLRWTPASDPNPVDRITYNVWLGVALDDLQFEGSGVTTEHRVGAIPLADSTTYYWRVEAEDLQGNTSMSEADSFFVWLAPQPFALISPADGEPVYRSRPRFKWHAARDETPDDEITYRVVVYSDAALTTPIETVDDISDTTAALQSGLSGIGVPYYWRVQAQDLGGRTVWSSESFEFTLEEPPHAYAVAGFPNPYVPQQGAFTLRLDIPVELDGKPVTANLYDALGRRVRQIATGIAEMGSGQEFVWDGRRENGARLPAGVYFLRVTIGAEKRESRVILIESD